MMAVDWKGFVFPKERAVKLEGEDYDRFKNKIFERDGWRCRNPQCRSRRNLTLHHKIKRSRLRLDTEENCMTLCAFCHDRVERNELKVESWW